MTTLTIHDLPDLVRQALLARADRNGRSLDAEVREILEEAAGDGNAQSEASATPQAKANMDLGTLLYTIGREAQLTDEEVDLYFNAARDKTPMRVVNFDDPA